MTAEKLFNKKLGRCWEMLLLREMLENIEYEIKIIKMSGEMKSNL